MSELAVLGGEKIRNKAFTQHALIGDEEKTRISEVLKGGMLSGFVAKKGDSFLGGSQVRELESSIRKYFDIDFAVTVNSATAGLHVAVGACNIGPGDEAIVTPYTMSASATSILMQNAVPVFVDIDENTFCIDPVKIEKAITPRTKAIIVVHLFGYPADMDFILKIAEKHDLYVIEDCAQAPGALYKDKLVGTIGDIGIFSFNQHKIVTSGEGGFSVTNDKELALRMQLIRNHGEAVIDDNDGFTDIVGFNYRMTELEAAVGIGQFKRLDFLNNHRIKLADYLTRGLSGFKGLILPKTDKLNKHVYFVYPIKFQEEIVGVSRDAFVKALVAEGIPFGAGYVKPLYLAPLYQRGMAYGEKGCPFTCSFYNGKVDYAKGICPVVERMYEKELMLTAVCRHPHTEEDMDDVIRAFEKIFNNIEKIKTT